MKYDYIIWDFNGTIVDDLDLCLDIINKLLKKRNLPHLSKRRYMKVFRFPVIEYYKDIGFDFTKESFDDVSVEFISEYQPRSYDCKFVKTTIETIKLLKDKGYKHIVLSASEQNNLNDQLKKFKIDNLFEQAIGTNNVQGISKVEGAKAWRRKHKKDKVLLIGDTLHDAEAALAINCDCILIAQGHQNKKRLLTSGYKVLNHTKDLLKELD